MFLLLIFLLCYYCFCCLMKDFLWMVRKQKGHCPNAHFSPKPKSEKTDHILLSHSLVVDETCDGFDCIFYNNTF